MNAVWKCCLLLAMALIAVPLPAKQFSPAAASSLSSPSASQASATSEKLAQLDQRVTAAQSSADNAWMLVSAALVLIMTGPGLALTSIHALSAEDCAAVTRWSN